LGDDITSRTWKDAQDISWPNISRYTSFKSAVAFRSASTCEPLSFFVSQWSLTHVLPSDFCSAFLQTVLDILLLIALMVPQTSDEVVQGFLKPAKVLATCQGLKRTIELGHAHILMVLILQEGLN
jgi:hypothetical protein